MSEVTSYSLCYFSAGGMELSSLSAGVSIYRDKGGKVKVTAHSQAQLFDRSRQEAFVHTAMQADIVIINLHGGRTSCPAFEQLMEAMANETFKQPYLHIQPSGGDEDALEAARKHSSNFGTQAWDTLRQYLDAGGHVNFQRLLLFIRNLLFDCTEDCLPPLKLPDEGIYHPSCEGVPELSAYLRERVDSKRPTVGLWFYQTYWVNNNLAFIDALIHRIEAQGANVIPVFHQRYKDVERGNRGADYVVEHFFMDKGEPRIDVLISPMMFSLTLTSPEYRPLLDKLGVVCLQALVSMNSFAAWHESEQGLGSMDVCFSAAQPEFDGNIITVPVATREQQAVDPITGALLTKYEPIIERIDKLVKLACNWARLRTLENHERRVAIIFHHYPPRNDRIGCAAGLDSFSSVKRLLDQMQQEGYQLEQSYLSGDELAEELLSRMTADQRWLTPDKMAERTEAVAGPEEYLKWNHELPENIRGKMVEDWGESPGELFVHGDKLLFAGLTNGNVFITIQPPRGYFENIDKAYHDLYLSTPHHYLAQYRWIRDLFKADVVVHVGKHGSLEWLPGKALGLSESCYPDLAIMELPNIYPYIINDPSEGTQAKRRSYACIIDHLTPAFTSADLYEDLSRIENLLNDYHVALSEDPGKVKILQPMIWEAVTTAHLDQDLSLTREEALDDFSSFLDRLHGYLQELGETMIGDGLHTLGVPPEGERLEEFVVQLTRLSNGSVPSLRETVIAAMGFDLDDLLENRGRRCPSYAGQTGGQILDLAHRQSLLMVQQLGRKNWDLERVEEVAAEHHPAHIKQLAAPLTYIAGTLVPNIRKTTQEITATLTAMSGSFVKPGPSGAPSRGQAEILPTGRNFYSVDPSKIPSPAAWEVGKRLAEALLEHYLKETGKYPDSIGILVFGGPTMRTRGDDIAEIYYLMGLRPVWQKGSGQVSGLEVIPLRELGRPRMDVVPRVSGFFRDAFPNLMEQIDEAVAIVSALNEPPEANFLRQHVLLDMEDLRTRGMDEEEARREATFRVFSCPPGTYGAGVSELVESKNWQTREDLGNNYIRYSAHAYGKDSYGKQQPVAFRRLLSRMDVTVKNEDSREYDMLSCTDYYNYYGGLIAAAETMREGPPLSIMGDSADPRRVKMRTTAEEAKHVLRSRLVNPKWLAGMQRHGYKGAGDISHMMDVVLGWDATAGVIDDWMYQAVAESYALEPEMREWMKKVNPYALQNIIDKLLEASSRGMWQADRKTEEDLRDVYLEMEGEIEERTE